MKIKYNLIIKHFFLRKLTFPSYVHLSQQLTQVSRGNDAVNGQTCVLFLKKVPRGSDT